MNKKDRLVKILTNYKKYHISGMPNYARPKKNTCSPQGGLRHSMAIMLEAWCINKYGHHVDFTDIMREALQDIDDEVKKMELVPNKEENSFVCEIVPNEIERHDRRIDIVNLFTGDEVEVETNHKIKKEGASIVYI